MSVLGRCVVEQKLRHAERVQQVPRWLASALPGCTALCEFDAALCLDAVCLLCAHSGLQKATRSRLSFCHTASHSQDCLVTAATEGNSSATEGGGRLSFPGVWHAGDFFRQPRLQVHKQESNAAGERHGHSPSPSASRVAWRTIPGDAHHRLPEGYIPHIPPGFSNSAMAFFGAN